MPGSSWIGRTAQSLRNNTSKMFAMPPPHEWGKGPPPVVTLAALRSEADLGEFVVGCDADIGGKSHVNLSLDEHGFGRFHGALSTHVSSGMRVGHRKVVRSGYAGMRTVDKRSVFGRPRTWDTSFYNFLHIRLRNMIPTPSRFYVNLQTDGANPKSLYQHRLWLHHDVGTDWQSILVPFDDFTLTAQGNVVENQIGMFRNRVRTIGISVLGPGEGPFDLRIAAFRLCNITDAIPPETIRTQRPPASDPDAPLPVPAASAQAHGR